MDRNDALILRAALFKIKRDVVSLMHDEAEVKWNRHHTFQGFPANEYSDISLECLIRSHDADWSWNPIVREYKNDDDDVYKCRDHARINIILGGKCVWNVSYSINNEGYVIWGIPELDIADPQFFEKASRMFMIIYKFVLNKFAHKDNVPNPLTIRPCNDLIGAFTEGQLP
jgi:hypothetical protein